MSPPRAFFIAGRHFGPAPGFDWQAAQAARPGGRPRRIGEWAALALHGAQCCLDDSGEASLPESATLTLCTVHGPDIALRAALREAREGLPMPFGFLASQPGQVLPVLARALGWQGDGRCLATRRPEAALRRACADAGPGGVLAGWVEEDPPAHSHWLRLRPAVIPAGLEPAAFGMLADPACRYLAFDGADLLVSRSPEPPRDA